MKLKSRIKNQVAPGLLVAMALAVSGSAGWGASTIKLNNFDTDTQIGDWGANGTTLTWDGTQDAGGSTAVGCMKVQYPAGTNPWGTQPQRNLGAQAFHSSEYWSVSFDFKIDPTSSLGGDLNNAPYGHVQVIPIDNNWKWLSGFGWTAITDQFTNWQHLEMGFSMPYTNLNALVVQVGDGAFSSDVIFYIDNLQVNPVPASLIVNQFTNSASSGGWNWQNWSAPGTSEWVAAPDAGGGDGPGSLKLTCNFANQPAAYQQCVFQKNYSADPNRFTYLDMDVKLDPSSYPMFNGNTYGLFEVILAVDGNWRWATLGSVNLTASHTNWTHLSYPVGGKNATNMQAFVIKLGGGWAQDGFTNTVILNIDNVRFWTPQVSPTLSLAKSGPGGLQIISTAPADDWQRQGIVTPDWTRDYSWFNRGQPVTYSFTIADYPPAAKNPGFEAHVYLVNFDTLNSISDEIYSGVDWNAKDLINVKLQNNAAAGGVDFSFNFKTNLPGANVNQTVAVIHSPTAIGTFALTFNDNTSVTLTTPGGSTNFNIAPALAEAFASQVTLHFGTFKNRIVNNWAKATFSRIQVTGVSNPIDEKFPGPGLNPDPANLFWRLAADPAGLVWVPAGTAYWLNWSLPDTGFTPQSAAAINGIWGDPGITYISTGSISKSAAIPAANLPSGNAGFFRLIKTGP